MSHTAHPIRINADEHRLEELLHSSEVTPEQSLATANLPLKSYLPTRPQFSTTNSTGDRESTGLSAPNIINYRLRKAFATESSITAGRQAAFVACEDHWEWERNHIFDIRTELITRLDRASPFLAGELQDAIDTQAIAKVIENRRWWYQHHLPSKIKQASTNANEYHNSNDTDIRSVLVVSESTFRSHVDSDPPSTAQRCILDPDNPSGPTLSFDTPPDAGHVILSEAFIKTETNTYPSRVGFTLPQQFLAARSASRAFYHLFLPWYGTIMCTCEYATQPSVPLCKHEVAVLSQITSQPHHNTWYNGTDIHPRFTRAVPHFSSESLFRLTPDVTSLSS